VSYFCKTFVKQRPTKLLKKYAIMQIREINKSAEQACMAVEWGKAENAGYSTSTKILLRAPTPYNLAS
jgi:hypothetical protein